jgi:tRNA (guanine10-N2)-dimethyltransferase
MNKENALLILGRQPALGIAELESLYGANHFKLIGNQVLISDLDTEDIDFKRLGGSVKLAEVLYEQDTTDWAGIHSTLVSKSASLPFAKASGKLRLGISAIDIQVTPKQLMATGLSMKRVLKDAGQSLRFVPNTSLRLNSAQVLHNRLTHAGGLELILVKAGNKTICAQTVKEQDIADYSRRDYGRPKRDLRVGLLPPKLAQIIINLGGGPENNLSRTVLDPFCGGGVLLQEALLMGYKVFGSDIDERMVNEAETNVSWLVDAYRLDKDLCHLAIADATSFVWKTDLDFIASETYLGRHFSPSSTPEVIAQGVSDCNHIIKKFLQNIAGQLKSGTRLCLAVPAWQVAPDRFKHLPLIDQINDLGYIRVSFEHVLATDLIYFRKEQSVARELLVLRKR